MAKSAEHQQLQDSNRCNTASVPCFECFQIQQSIGLSVESIDSSHRHFLSRQQLRFLQATFQLHQSRYFQQQALRVGLRPFLVALSILRVASPAQRKCRQVNESESNEECHCLDWSWNFNTDVSETSLNLAVHYNLILHLNQFAKRCMLWVFLSFLFPL